MRAFFLLLCVAAGLIAAVYGQPYMKGNAEAVTIIITVFTVFAGFLIAILAVLGDPSFIPEGSWRVAENRRALVENKLYWHFWLFIFYLLTIALLFVGILLKEELSLRSVTIWIERAFLFFGVTSFFLSFALPWSLMQLQQNRIDAEIERRRAKAGIGSDASGRDQ